MRTSRVGQKPGPGTNDSASSAWIDREVEGCSFKDVRLAKRFGKLLGMMSEGIGESIPYACQDWANTKAAYRFFSNGDVSEDQIMAGHFQKKGSVRKVIQFSYVHQIVNGTRKLNSMLAGHVVNTSI